MWEKNKDLVMGAIIVALFMAAAVRICLVYGDHDLAQLALLAGLVVGCLACKHLHLHLRLLRIFERRHSSRLV